MHKKHYIDFAFKKLPQFSKQMLDSYFNLPMDKYLLQDQCFRERRFSQVTFSGSATNLISGADFFQNQEINHYAGGLTRDFAPIEQGVIDEFCQLFIDQVSPLFCGCDVNVGFHQIRITCADNYVGYPVPEGWHQDGFDYLAISCINAENICGGISRVREDMQSDSDFLSKILKPSEMLILNDRHFHHYTDPINNVEKGKKGFRDLLVTTISLID